MKKFKGEVLLLLTSFIWGFAFIAQSTGMEHVGPFSFNALRFFFGSLTLFIIILIRYFITPKERRKPLFSKYSLIGGLCSGIFLFLAASFQQVGILYTTTGKAGFITALYILFVPLISIFLKKKVSWNIWISILIGLIGFYFLCINQGFNIGKGDILILICAFIFSFHILCIDYFAPKTDGIEMSCIQFISATVLSLIPMVCKETITFECVLNAKWSILYAGILSCALAYTLQIVGQKYTAPTIASLIMSLESVFAVIGGVIILKESLSDRELIGCILIFTAIIFSQVKIKKLKKS